MKINMMRDGEKVIVVAAKMGDVSEKVTARKREFERQQPRFKDNRHTCDNSIFLIVQPRGMQTTWLYFDFPQIPAF